MVFRQKSPMMKFRKKSPMTLTILAARFVERDNALVEINRLQTVITTNFFSSNRDIIQLNGLRDQTEARLNRHLHAAHQEIIQLGGRVPESTSPRGLHARRPQTPEAPGSDPLEDYVDDDDPNDEVRIERDDAIAARDLRSQELNNATLRNVLLQMENDRLQAANARLTTELREARDEANHNPPAAPVAPQGPIPGEAGSVNPHTPPRQPFPGQAEPAGPTTPQGSPAHAGGTGPVDPHTPSPSHNSRIVIGARPSPPSAALRAEIAAQGRSNQPVPTVRAAVPGRTAPTRVSRSTVAAGDAPPPPDLLSPNIRDVKRRKEAATQAAAKPSGVTKKKPATKGKGRKK